MKADYKDTKSLTTDISSLTTDDIQKFKNMNPVWNAARGTEAQSSWNYNEKASAWLCAPSQWTTYVDSTKATYSIPSHAVHIRFCDTIRKWNLPTADGIHWSGRV